MSSVLDACYFCDRQNPSGAKFCGQCGHSLLTPRCQTCRARIEPGSAFCSRCGSPFGGDGPVQMGQPEEQIRQVTVVFALLSGVQALVEQCDPEELKDLLDACFRILTAEVVARGGTIDKYMADSLMALFGVPVAHEDDPARAVSAALGMLEALEPFNRQLFATRGFTLELKIGINTGRVLVGSVGGSRDVTVMGDVVNTASRVEQAAPVGTILVCESTRRGLAERFVLKAQPPLRVKGKVQPLNVFKVLREQGAADRSGLDLSSIPLIGREDVFETLVGGWRKAVRPDPRHELPYSSKVDLTRPPVSEPQAELPGCWITLVADVGMGKARLMREFQRYVEQDPLQPEVLVTLGTSYATGAGLAVMRRLLDALIGGQPEDTLAITWQRLLTVGRTLAGVDPATGEVVRPETVARSLLRLMGLPSPEGPVEPPQLSSLQGLRQEGLLWLRAFIAQRAQARPLFIIADDLHLADEAALDCLEALGGDLPGRVMLLTASRPSLLERRPGWGQSNPAHRRLELRPLTLPEAQTLVRAIAGELTPVSPRVVETLHTFTGGNPLYLTETLREQLETHGPETLLSDSGVLSVPSTLEGVLQSRLDRLPFEAGLTVRAAAVIGTPFWRGAITALLGTDRGDALDLLRSRGIIQRRAISELPGEEEYLFDHALTARVAAGNLLESTRKRYHRLVAEWLAAHQSQTAMLELVTAEHFEAAGEADRAVPYLARAAEQALASYDCGEAIRLINRALVGLGDGGLAQSSDNRSLALKLLSWRGEAQRMLGRLEPALADFQAAAQAALALGERTEAAASWYRAGLVYLGLGMVQQALHAAQTGDAQLREDSSPQIIATGLQLRGELLMLQGHHAEAREALEGGIRLWKRLEDRWRLAQGLHTLGRLAMATADHRGAQRVFREAAQLRESLGDTHGLALTLHNLGAAADRLGEFPEALAHYHRSLRLNRRVGNRRALAATLMNQGVGYTRTGYYGRALVALEESLELHRALERSYEIGACEGNLGMLWLQLGQVETAIPLFQASLERFRTLDRQEAISEFLVGLGQAQLMTGALADAEAAALEAFEASRVHPGGEAEARALQLLCAVSLGQDQVELARQYLEELEWNEEAQQSSVLQLQTALLNGWIRLATGQGELALARFEEAVQRAVERDLAAAVWQAQRAVQQALELNHQPLRREALDEAWQELLARVEDPALVALLRQSQWLGPACMM